MVSQRKQDLSQMTQHTIIIVAIFSLLVLSASGAVFTVDFGSESIKVAVVNPQPGQSPISIAINEMSKRKSPALVALSNEERLVSEEAAGIVARYPERVYSLIREMIGKPVSSVEELIKSKYLPYDLVTDPERGTVRVRTHDGKIEYRAEELVAMILSYAGDLANAHAKSIVKDAVVTIPPYFGQSQRQAMLDAAQISGINVMALIHEHAGAALQYGIDKDFSNGSRDVLFYDMGATKTYAAVVHFSSYVTRDRGKNVTANQFQIKGVRWDAELGGQALEQRLLEYFASEFNKIVGRGFEIRNYPKSVAKLKKEVKRTKEILSANSEAPISVESLYEERDFRSSITREKFEELCSDLWGRALVPLKSVLQDCGLKPSDLFAVELLGGGTRVPKLKAVLSNFVGEKGLDRHLDADEAISLGSSLFAANLSDGFKLNRKIGMVDGIPYGILFKVENLNGESMLASLNEGEESSELVLFPRFKKLPTKVLRSLKNQTEDLRLTISYDASGNLPPGIPSHVLSVYEILGISNASIKYSSYNLTHPLKTSLHFVLSKSGVVSLDRAETVVEFSEWVEVPVPVETENSTLKSSNSSDSAANDTISSSSTSSTDESTASDFSKDSNVKSAEANNETDNNRTINATGEDVPDGNATESENSAPKFVMKKKLRRRTIRVPLKVQEISQGYSKPMSAGNIEDGIKKMSDLKKKELEKRITAEAKNSLESFIYATKDKFEYSEDISRVSTEAQRDSVRSELADAEDWLYMDGADGNADAFIKKLSEIRVNADEITFRLEELNARPKAVADARNFISKTETIINSWETSRPWINKTEIDPVIEDLKNLDAWVTEKEELQNKTPLHENPVFTSEQVSKKVDAIQKQVSRLLRIPKPKPKPAAKMSSEDKTMEGETSDSPKPGNQTDDANEIPKAEDITIPSSNSSDTSEAERHDEL